MVTVIMCQQQAIHILDIPFMRCQTEYRLSRADTRIDQQSRVIRFDIEAIALAARLEWYDFHADIVKSSVADGSAGSGGQFKSCSGKVIA